MEPLSLDQLLASVPPHLLDQKITNNIHLEDIARSLGNWRAAVVYLGLSEADEEEIKEENSRTDAQRRALLRKWRSKYGPNATYRNLAKCFYKGEKIEMVETICKILQPSAAQYQQPAQNQPTPHYQPAPSAQYQPTSQYPAAAQYQSAPSAQYHPQAHYQPHPQYQPAPQYQSVPPYPPAGGYYPQQSGAMYQQPSPSGQQYYTPNSHTQQPSATNPTSVKMSGTQTPEYQKLQENFDTIIRQLGAAQAAEELADKLFTKKLITSDTRDKASLATLTSAGKMRVLIPAVMAQVEIDPANYHTFLTVLRAISGAEHMADYLERKK